MVRIFLYLLALILLFPSAGCYSNENPSVKQGQEEPSNTWDFGVAKQGEILKHSFFLKNESPKPLNIKEVHTSCGCTVSAVKKMKLLPGEETEIEVKFNTMKYVGEVRQFVYLNTDSLDKPVIRYIIKADVKSDFKNPKSKIPNPK
jgi:hypothetical protein